MKSVFVFFLLLSGTLLWRCTDRAKPLETGTRALSYATGFVVKPLTDHARLVEVRYPYPSATKSFSYLLVDRGTEVPSHDQDVPVIEVPIRSMICTSTTHIPLLDYLKESNRLVGFPHTDYISSKPMRARIDSGFVKELGHGETLDLEAIATLKPEVLMGYTMSADMGQLKKIQQLGIPVIINSEFLEPHPLGRAEWIKFMALFVGKEKMADSVFAAIESSYLEVQKKARTVSNKPTVLSGVVYGDAWFMPGGKNYAAQLLEDAGCHYLWSDNPSRDYLRVNVEEVFSRARDAQLWIGASDFRSLQELAAADQRYTLFKPFQNKMVFTYNARLGSKGGNEFLELGYLRPDLILKDLVAIAHPELVTDHPLFFYAKLP